MNQDAKARFLRAALYFFFGAFVVLWSLMALGGCAPQNSAKSNRVTLYCSVDEVYAKPLIKRLETQTGLQIDALFDTEATKTAGLANRIRAERGRPRCDVFWSSALLQTLLMSDEKLLQPYDSPSARDLPPQFRGKDWVGVGARARVLTEATGPNIARSSYRLPQISTLDKQNWGLGISNPQFGTASDWSTALAVRWGEPRTLDFFRKMTRISQPVVSANGATRQIVVGVRVLPGNGDVARETANGNLGFGLTDSDDFLAQVREKKKITFVVTTSDNVLVPGAASILQGAPHPENAKKLFDALVSAQNEKNLTQGMPGVFSLRHLKEKSNFQSGGVDFSFLMGAPRDDYSKWAATWREIREPLNQIFDSK